MSNVLETSPHGRSNNLVEREVLKTSPPGARGISFKSFVYLCKVLSAYALLAQGLFTGTKQKETKN